MSNAILSNMGWYFLPNLVTGYVQTFYYNLTIRAGEPKPQPGSPTFVKHRRFIHAAVIVTYLLYQLFEADWEVRQAGDFYAVLGVPHDVDGKTLQSRFRRLTVLHHPDKIANPANRAAAEQYYVLIKLARDTLLDPAKRFAYDRFGPDIIAWKQCTKVREFVMSGIQQKIPYYVGSTVVLFIFGYMGMFNSGKYWRYIAFAALAVLELHTITRPYFPAITVLPTVLNPLARLPLPFPIGIRNPYLPFQLLQVARTAIITFFVALNQIAPLLQDPTRPLTPLDNTDEALLAQMGRVEQVVAVNAVESARLLKLEGVPFVQADGQGGTVALPVLQEKIKQWFVTNAVRNDPEVREAVTSVVQRRNGIVPEPHQPPIAEGQE